VKLDGGGYENLKILLPNPTQWIKFEIHVRWIEQIWS